MAARLLPVNIGSVAPARSAASFPGVEALFEAVKTACLRGIWSRGVELARAGAVAVDSQDDDEYVLRVATPGRVVTPTVVLYVTDEEWECDCGAREDPCMHVAAAAIAIRRATQEGRDLADSDDAPGRLSYRFQRQDGGLEFERFVVLGDTETLFTSTLAAVTSGRVDGPALAPTQADLQIERILGSQRRGRLPRGILHKLLGPLANCADVRLDGEPIRTSKEPAGMRAAVDDAPDGGFRVSLERDPPLTERVGEAMGRFGDTLRELGTSGLLGRELEELRDGRSYPADEAATLAAEVLPALSRRMPVVVRTARLPSAERERPRLVIETTREGDALSVLATLVYGDPPSARVDAGKLVPLSGRIPMRDRDAEERLVSHLRGSLGLEPGRRRVFDPSEAIALRGELEEFRGELSGGAHEGFFLAPPLRPQIDPDPAHFAVRFEPRTQAGDGSEPGTPTGSATAEAVLGAWRAGASLVPLIEGGFASLPDAWLSQHGARLADLLAARGDRGGLSTAALPDLAEFCDGLGLPAPPGLAALRPLLEGGGALPTAPLPEDLRGALRPYQQQGVDWLRFLGDAGLGALLADDMGLGKTLQTLCAVRGRTLVVCPTSVLSNWAEEAARFRPGLSVCLYHGPRRQLEPADLTLTSYALLRLDRTLREDVEWDTVVLDEAQTIKNPDSQSARAAYALRAPIRIALTGTPVENRLEELWSQLQFANPGLLGSRSDFQARYARPIAEADADAAARLRGRIRPYVLRRRKREVAPELPPRQDLVLHCELSDAERAIYDAVRAATVPELVAKLQAGGSVLAILEALLRLRQACCHPALLPGQEAEGSAKLELLLSRLETAVADGHKALVFSQWTSLLDLIEPQLETAAIPFVRLDGSTRDRPAVLRTFAAEDGPPVLLISLKAGGTGLNLTSADHVFLMDPWWNPAVEDQAADRAHRIGQTRPVLLQRIVAKDTVEERILALQERKRALAEAALGSGSGAAAAPPTREELLELLD